MRDLVLPSSPLGGGVLTGKYTRADVADSREAELSATRKGVMASARQLSERALDIADAAASDTHETSDLPVASGA